MNKKKVLTLITAVSLVGVIGVGSTLAYFTDKEDITNVITMDHVDITLFENTVVADSDGNYTAETEITEEGLAFSDVVAGQTLPKNPTVEVEEGSADSYVRVKMTIENQEGSNISQDDLNALKDLIVINDGWTLNEEDGYYYYGLELEEKAQVTLFDEVTIPTSWGNDTADQSFAIKLQAEAIQAHFTDDVVTKDADDNVIAWSLTADEIEEY